MNYKVTKEQLDKVIKPYFDKWFINSEYGTKRYVDLERWTGFWLVNGSSKILLVGHPAFDDSGIWYSNGHILDGWSYFNIEPKEFYDLMGRYLEKKFEISVGKIT